jgi:23S rRNA (cytidine1920-2'-O)/16S rRNA (cytidine1409-2'-O)-methyltransferase
LGNILSTVRRRADQLVFEQGLTESREKATRLILAGKIAVSIVSSSEKSEDKSVLRPVPKPGHAYPVSTRFALIEKEQYVSRGAYKLLTALENFKIDVNGFVCLDAGASTGGFVDCLLQRGAARVYAVDVGHNQLHEKLRNDARVINIEGVNLRKAAPDLIREPVDIVTADVSFISLTLVLPPCLFRLKPGGRLAALIKPQFELGPGETVRGIVRDESARQRAVEKIVTFCTEKLGLRRDGVIPSAVKGPKGNQEYMAVFTSPTPSPGFSAFGPVSAGEAP